MRTIQISIAKSKQKYQSNVVRFETVQVSSLKELAIISTEKTWSPCRWRGGYRLSENYLGCDLAVWDFDDGEPTINKMTEHCLATGFEFFIATTRSHLIEKPGHPIGDRYRLVMPTSKPYSADPNIFAEQMKMTMQIYGRKPDRSCHDAARYYFPGSVVVAGMCSRRLFVPPSGDKAAKSIESQKSYVSNYQTRVKSGALRRDVMDFINSGKTQNGRANACYVAGAELALKPLTPDQIVAIVMESPFPRHGEKSSDTITDREIIRNVKNGIKSVRKGTKI